MQVWIALRLPSNDNLIRKSTRLLVSESDTECLSLLSPGPSDPAHAKHDVVQGSSPGVPSASASVAAYTPKFVHAVLETVPAFRSHRVLCLQEDCLCSHKREMVCAVTDAKPDKEDLVPIIKKLHQNLGHPPSNDMVRILKHSQASAEATEVARS